MAFSSRDVLSKKPTLWGFSHNMRGDAPALTLLLPHNLDHLCYLNMINVTSSTLCLCVCVVAAVCRRSLSILTLGALLSSTCRLWIFTANGCFRLFQKSRIKICIFCKTCAAATIWNSATSLRSGLLRQSFHFTACALKWKKRQQEAVRRVALLLFIHVFYVSDVQ